MSASTLTHRLTALDSAHVVFVEFSEDVAVVETLNGTRQLRRI
jgi:hypothetical protein